ncbi:T9SS type A sorting domain-containing protein [Adhaeribacter pallidiroseus]|uniref:Secretion system C-terminal sorting domain-containing protein n=1 Tax=Adhaeribacter pallidiroseus TaxID=2072847 RepID=A0A369QKF6_9BACT|nr:T9SS type A sorting domain-containing protein [Adhaeribacter pallidiroseus]RDC64872.1 hypothetical protein AHMF7616_03494 [Adhaeribacter pallidiroseus]
MKNFSTPVFRLLTTLPETNPWWCRLSTTFCFCLGLSAATSAQNQLWDKYLNSGYNGKTIVLPTTDGGYIVGGSSSSGISKDKSQASRGGSDYWIIKLDADRNKVWDKTLGGTGTEQLTALQLTQDGGYILGGFSDSNKGGDKTQVSKGKSDYWVVKITGTGAKVWDQTLGGIEEDRLGALQQTQDGGFILGGSSISDKSGDKTQENWGGLNPDGVPYNDYWVVKLNASGATVWDKTLGGTSTDNFSDLQQTQDGGYILGGTSYSGISGDKTEVSRDLRGADIKGDYWVIKLESDGTKAWDKTIGGTYGDRLFVVRQTKDGGYILGGTSNSYTSGDKTESFLGEYDGWDNGDYWVVKLDATGKKIWDKTHGGSENEDLNSLEQTQDGGYILAGETNASGEILKLTPNGDKVWNTGPDLNGNDYEKRLTSIVQTSDGGYLAGGEDTFEGGVYILKLAQNKAQTITFTPIPTKLYGVTPFTVSAKASSGLPVTYEVLSGSVELKGTTLTPTGVGTVTIIAYQAGNETYAPTQAKYTFNLVYPSQVTTNKVIGGSAEDKLAVMQKTKDGGYILGGSSKSGVSGDKTQASKGELDFWIVKLKADGRIEWNKTLGGSKSDQLKALQQTQDGGYILGGTSSSSISGDKSQAGKGQADYWVIKLNADGSKAWDKTWGGTSQDSLSALQQTKDGGYILGGYSYSNKSADKAVDSKGAADFWVVKLSATGAKEWDKTFGGSGLDILTSLQQTKDNGYILGGASASNISGDKTQVSRGGLDYWIVKLQADGSKEWDRTAGGDQKDYLTVVRQTADNNYILAGSSNSSDIGGDKSQPSKGKTDYWIVKVDSYGIDWNSTYGGNEDDYLTSIQELDNQKFLLGGYSASGVSGDKTEPNRGNAAESGTLTADYWVVKVEKREGISGTYKVWDKTIGGNGQEELIAALPTSNGNYVLGGSSNSGVSGDKTQASKGFRDYWIVDLNLNEMPTVPYWNMRYGGYLPDNFTTLIKTADGGYLSGGYTTSRNSGDVEYAEGVAKQNYWIIKTDRNGKKEWDKLYGGLNDDYLNQVIQTQDGGYLLAGSSFSGNSINKGQASRGGRDYWIVKIGAQGTRQWDKRFGGTGNDELKKVIQLTTGEYVLAGYSNSPASGDKSQGSQGGNDYWLIKLTKTGIKLWDKRYGGNQNDELESITLTATNGFILGGTSASGIGGDKTQASQGSQDFWLVRVDADGNKIWDKRYGGTGNEVLTTVGWNREYSPQTNVDGDYYLAGYSTSGISGDKKQASQGGKDFWFLQIKSNGILYREKSYGGSGDEELRSVLQTEEGDYLLAGSSNSGVSGDKSQVSKGNSDYWLVRINATGAKQYDQAYGGSDKEELRAMVLAEDGGIVLGGRSDSPISGDRSQPSQGRTDYWLIKIVSEKSGMVVSRVANEPELAIEQSSNVQLLVYPNPFQEKVTISFTLPETQPATVRVLDSQGCEITTLFQKEAQAKQAYQVEWQAGKQAAGMYLLQLQTPTGQITKKILRSR